MTTVLIVIHLMVVLAMIGLVLLQRSEGGALGIGGGGGFMTGRGAGNVLTRSTGVLAAVFFATSIGLALLARMEAGPSDIFQALPGQAGPAAPAPPVPAPAAGTPTSAQDLLEALGGPQAPPPASDAGAGAQAPAAPAAPPAEAPAPAAPAAPAPGSAPQ
jgi:preprotein translocase subunit SecG